jgi:hypothetical protein
MTSKAAAATGREKNKSGGLRRRCRRRTLLPFPVDVDIIGRYCQARFEDDDAGAQQPLSSHLKKQLIRTAANLRLLRVSQASGVGSQP